MKCKDIFKSALRLLNEKGAEDELGDFAERAPYILSAMFSASARLDKAYRAAFGLGEQEGFSPTYSELDTPFPLCERFSSAAAFYLASLLIVDDNDDLSDNFYDKYCDSMASISAEIPAAAEKIRNVY